MLLIDKTKHRKLTIFAILKAFKHIRINQLTKFKFAIIRFLLELALELKWKIILVILQWEYYFLENFILNINLEKILFKI